MSGQKSSCGPLAPCPSKPSLASRQLIVGKDAIDVALLFKVLANETRISLLHALARAGELCVTDLAGTVGRKPQAISNQLQRLVDRGMLTQRRAGNHVHYSIVDPCVTELLDRGLCLLEDARARARSSRP